MGIRAGRYGLMSGPICMYVYILYMIMRHEHIGPHKQDIYYYFSTTCNNEERHTQRMNCMRDTLPVNVLLKKMA